MLLKSPLRLKSLFIMLIVTLLPLGAGLGGNGGERPAEGLAGLSVDPATLDFGTVEVGTEKVLSVTISNATEPGAEALTLADISLDGDEISDPVTILASLDPDDNTFGGEVEVAVMSDDARYVAFAVRPSNISVPYLYRRELLTWTTEPVAVNAEGNPVPVSEFSGSIGMTPDGRYVAFLNSSTNNPPIPDGPKGIYIRDMDTGVTELIDIPTTDGELPDWHTPFTAISISADARIVAFESRAPNLLPGPCDSGDENPCRDIYVYDRDTETLERASTAFDGTPTDHNSRYPIITSDGRYVVFRSWASNLVSDDTNDVYDVFVRDRDTGITERVSVAADGSEGNDGSSGHNTPAISPDGRYVAFYSHASNLVPDDTNGWPDMFVRDRVAGTTERVSLASDGAQANWPSSSTPDMSSDGRYVAFHSSATNLVPDDTNDTIDHFLRDRLTGMTERISVRTDGTEIDAHSWGGGVGISADGRFAAFMTVKGLVPEDSNGEMDIYVRDRGGVVLGTASAITGGDCAVDTVLEPDDSCTVEITFSPFRAGDFEGTLNVEASDGQSASVMLHGTTPEGPVLAFNPPGLDFGEVETGTTSVPQSASLTNAGDSDTTGLGFTETGGSDFFDADITDCGNTLPAGESCQVVITFTPPGAGGTFAALHAQSDEGAAARLNLMVRGVEGGPESIFEDRFEEKP